MTTASWLQSIPGSERWRALFFTRGPRVATWVLALALGVQAAMIVTDLAGAGRAPSPGTIVSASRVQRPAVDIAAITKTHLFGEAPLAASNGANAPQTNMPLVLTGVIAANNPDDGLAILGPALPRPKCMRLETTFRAERGCTPCSPTTCCSTVTDVSKRWRCHTS